MFIQLKAAYLRALPQVNATCYAHNHAAKACVQTVSSIWLESHVSIQRPSGSYQKDSRLEASSAGAGTRIQWHTKAGLPGTLSGDTDQSPDPSKNLPPEKQKIKEEVQWALSKTQK